MERNAIESLETNETIYKEGYSYDMYYFSKEQAEHWITMNIQETCSLTYEKA